MQKQGISVVISAFNEEQKISACLESVRWADEIIVVDNQSSDRTVEIAKKYTKHVFSRPNNLMLNVNKNYGFFHATHSWILSLDADERVSETLAKEIQNLSLAASTRDGFWIPRKNIIFGKWMKHTGWYPDLQLRLFRHGKGKFPEEHVHEMVEVEGKTGTLSEHLIHYNYETIEQFIHKTSTIYVPSEVKKRLETGYVSRFEDAIRFPTEEFLSRFFAREGYKDGFHGLILSLLMAFYHFLIFVSCWQQQGFKELGSDSILSLVEQEGKETERKIKLWFFQEKKEQIKNPLRKTVMRIRQKLR